jgi:hypothetical protein
MNLSEQKEVIELLKDDANYYGKIGKQYRSNSDIMTLLKNPLSLGDPQPPNMNFVIGSYFHTAILEPEKLENFKIIDASSRNTKVYKEESEGEMCLLAKEVEKLKVTIETVKNNEACKFLIYNRECDFEQPNIKEIKGTWWKGKADIINHTEGLVIDLKTTSDIGKFKSSAYRYNYDSQAYIYKQLFGYDLVFIAVDKTTNQIGIFECSDEFYASGESKVIQAMEQYKLFYENAEFKPEEYVISDVL